MAWACARSLRDGRGPWSRPASPCSRCGWRSGSADSARYRRGMTHDPIHRASMTFEREGDGLWVHTQLDPGGNLPEHFHPTLTETWEVVEGSAGVKLEGEWRELTAADGPVLVNPYARHALRNTGSGPARLRCWVTPAG